MQTKDMREIHKYVYKNRSMKQIYNNPNRLVRWISRKRIKTICKMINKFSTGYSTSYILDVGCEDCFLFDNLQTSAMKVGLDFLSEPLFDANNNYLLVEGDANLLPFKSNTFDVTICSETLEHVTDPPKVLKEISRVTKNYSILSVPDDNVILNAKKMVKMFNKKSLEDLSNEKVPEHINSWKSKEFIDLVKQYFDIQKIKLLPLKIITIVVCKPKKWEECE
jgi:ubiquinone/menaquinone biosynthesis C-methylase UbiE